MSYQGILQDLAGVAPLPTRSGKARGRKLAEFKLLVTDARK